MSLVHVCVSDLDDAVDYYQSVFGLHKEQKEGGDATRIILAGKNKGPLEIHLSRLDSGSSMANEESIGQWHSASFWDDYHTFSAFGVLFQGRPIEHEDKLMVHFRDAYGVTWLLTA